MVEDMEKFVCLERCRVSRLVSLSICLPSMRTNDFGFLPTKKVQKAFERAVSSRVNLACVKQILKVETERAK